jgi:hypothetical protein
MWAGADLMHCKQTGADYKSYIHAGADLMGHEQVGIIRGLNAG